MRWRWAVQRWHTESTELSPLSLFPSHQAAPSSSTAEAPRRRSALTSASSTPELGTFYRLYGSLSTGHLSSLLGRRAARELQREKEHHYYSGRLPKQEDGWSSSSSMGGIMTKQAPAPFRTIDIIRDGVTPGQEQSTMADNSVVTSKYNAVTFIPRSLFEQFRRIANVYFLVITVLMMLGTYTSLFVSPLAPFSTLVPLVLVLGVTMIKDGAEDLKRHRSDKRVRKLMII